MTKKTSIFNMKTLGRSKLRRRSSLYLPFLNFKHFKCYKISAVSLSPSSSKSLSSFGLISLVLFRWTLSSVGKERSTNFRWPPARKLLFLFFIRETRSRMPCTNDLAIWASQQTSRTETVSNSFKCEVRGEKRKCLRDVASKWERRRDNDKETEGKEGERNISYICEIRPVLKPWR